MAPAEAEVVAVSGTGDAHCTGFGCVAVSGTGVASGDAARLCLDTANSRACAEGPSVLVGGGGAGRALLLEVGVLGPAGSGWGGRGPLAVYRIAGVPTRIFVPTDTAVSGTGSAGSGLLAVGGHDASSMVLAVGGGNASSMVLAMGGGNAYSSTALALAGTGSATGDVAAASLLGPASTGTFGVIGVGGGGAGSRVAIGLLGAADAAALCTIPLPVPVSACVTGASASGTGYARGGLLAVSGQQDATNEPTCLYSGVARTLSGCVSGAAIAYAEAQGGTAAIGATGPASASGSTCIPLILDYDVVVIVIGVRVVAGLLETCNGLLSASALGDADGGAASASGAGTATASTTCKTPLVLVAVVLALTGACIGGVAVGGHGASGGLAALAAEGPATASDAGACTPLVAGAAVVFVFVVPCTAGIAASPLDDASGGMVSASGDGDATASGSCLCNVVGVAFTGVPAVVRVPGVAASGTGSAAEGFVSASATGPASAAPACVEVATAEVCEGGAAGSLMGEASCPTEACIAVSGTDHANGGIAASGCDTPASLGAPGVCGIQVTAPAPGSHAGAAVAAREPPPAPFPYRVP